MKKALDIIKTRLYCRIKDLKWQNIFKPGFHTFYLAGSALNKDRPNDYDLFGINPEVLVTDGIQHSSKNAKTFNLDGVLVQVCSYSKSNLTELLKSFDFAHVQVGATVEVNIEPDKDTRVAIIDVQATEEYFTAQVTGQSWYVGSEYPLSSLLRVFKYKERGFLANHRSDVLKILTGIVTRGFSSYQDFKDQLDAIDLAYVAESKEAVALFRALNKSEEKADPTYDP